MNKSNISNRKFSVSYREVQNEIVCMSPHLDVDLLNSAYRKKGNVGIAISLRTGNKLQKTLLVYLNCLLEVRV